METQRYQRKPIYVDAVQVTADNMKEVAQWCQGHLVQPNGQENPKPGSPFVKVRVHNPQRPRQTKAFVGDWVLYSEFYGYKVYTQSAFQNTFVRVEHEQLTLIEGESIPDGSYGQALRYR